MKPISSKVFFLALSFFAFSATFAQDTTNKPKPDTSKSPQPDTSNVPKQGSTSMKATQGSGTFLSNKVDLISSSFTKNEDKAEAKKEA